MNNLFLKSPQSAARFKRFLPVVYFFFLSSPVFSQPFVDIASAKRQEFFYHDKILLRQTEISFLYPHQFKSGNIFIAGFSASRLNVADGIAESPPYSLTPGSKLQTADYSYDLDAFSIPAGFSKKWKNEKWRTLLMAIPKYSSGGAATGKSLVAGGAVLFSYEKKKNRTYKFGLYASSEFFCPFIVPLLGIDFRLNDRLSLFGVLPGGMNAEYRISRRFYSGLSFYSVTTSFRLDETPGWDYVEYWDNQLKVFINFYPLKRLVLFAEGGRTVLQNFSFYRDGYRCGANLAGISLGGKPENTLHRSRNSDAFFITAGLAVRFRFDEK